jgi:hypothetical protein
MRRIRPHLTYANLMATIAVFIALGGTALGAVIITNNSQVARGTISGHNPPSGKHPNIIGGSVNGRDLAANLKASLRLHCPTGLRRAGDLCFEPNLRPGAALATALKRCATAQRRVPTLGELALVFDRLGGPRPSEWASVEWSDDSLGELGSRPSANSAGALVFGSTTVATPVPYRCVTSATN